MITMHGYQKTIGRGEHSTNPTTRSTPFALALGVFLFWAATGPAEDVIWTSTMVEIGLTVKRPQIASNRLDDKQQSRFCRCPGVCNTAFEF